MGIGLLAYSVWFWVTYFSSGAPFENPSQFLFGSFLALAAPFGVLRGVTLIGKTGIFLGEKFVRFGSYSGTVEYGRWEIQALEMRKGPIGKSLLLEFVSGKGRRQKYFMEWQFKNFDDLVRYFEVH